PPAMRSTTRFLFWDRNTAAPICIGFTTPKSFSSCRTRREVGGLSAKSSAAARLFVLSFAALGAQRPPADFEALPFAPRSYVCHRANAPLAIDGKLDEPAWTSASWSDPFVDIEGGGRPRPRFRTRMKMAWDDEYLYVAAEMEEPDIWATLTERDSVIFHDN